MNSETQNAAVDTGATDLSFLGNSDMAKLIGAIDWSATPLGPIAHWSPSLRTTVSLCLASNFPINIIWGSHNTQIYNDGYRVVCGDKHPAAMGMDYRECWASAWPVIGPPFEQAMAGNTSFLENQRMFCSVTATSKRLFLPIRSARSATRPAPSAACFTR
ncbi:MAG: sensor histidine kinase [Massilia sp.]|nr:sensor histidine kinase [Massilia sp.]